MCLSKGSLGKYPWSLLEDLCGPGELRVLFQTSGEFTCESRVCKRGEVQTIGCSQKYWLSGPDVRLTKTKTPPLLWQVFFFTVSLCWSRCDESVWRTWERRSTRGSSVMFYGKCITPVPSPQHCASAHSQGCVPNRAIRAVLYFESVFAGQTEKKKNNITHVCWQRGRNA